MITLSENHRRVLLSTLAYLDEQLGHIEKHARGSDVASPFDAVAADLAPTQRQIALDSVARLRGQLIEALDVLGLEHPQPRTQASWAIRTELTMIYTTLDDTRTSTLHGYGPLSPEAASAIEAVFATFRRGLERLDAQLSRGEERDVAARLGRLAAAPFDLAELRAVERIVRERGLVELLPMLDALVDALESDGFEIAFFGRVSSGKSSLLDTVLGTSILPVGVTPVTAVPTRIAYGAQPRLRLSFQEGADLEAPLERLAEFVTERENPDNRKRVTKVDVRIPSPRLRSGVAFIDTPGLGSLARVGARQAYAYLPRCDLGVLLVDGGGAVTPDDVAVVRAWVDAAIPGLVVVSKGDLLAPSDRERMVGYVAEELRRATDLDVRTWVVSSKGDDAKLALAWFDEEVAPRCARAREERDASLRRKLANLREHVIASLRARLHGRARASAVDLQALSRRVEDLLASARRASEAIDVDPAFVEACVSQIAASIAESSAQTARSAAHIEELAVRSVAESADVVRRSGRALVEQLRDALAEQLAALASDDALEPLRSEAAGALLGLGALSAEADLSGFGRQVARYPLVGSSLWRALLRSAARGRREAVHDALHRFAARTHVVCLATVDRLAQASDAILGPEREAMPPKRGSDAEAREIEADLQQLGALPRDGLAFAAEESSAASLLTRHRHPP
jgi:GTP-binding protein EngB required for normal cell division